MRTARPEPSGFAAKAKDLQALRDAVDQAAAVSGALWISYIFAFLYLAIAAGAVTHKDLFFENSVKLPFLNVELPLTWFFVLGPLLFLIVHAYTLLHFAMLAGKVRAFHTELETTIPLHSSREDLRRQLPSNIFVQFLAGPSDVCGGTMGFLLRLIAWISLIIGPICLLVFFQLQFLPYHAEAISWWQRVAIMIDLILLWILWPKIARVTAAGLLRQCYHVGLRVVGLTALSLLSLLLITVATFRTEWLHAVVPLGPRFVPTSFAKIGPEWWEKIRQRQFQDISWKDTEPVTLYEFLVGGEADPVTQRPKSWWSNRLVVPGIDVREIPKFDTKTKIEVRPTTVSLRGRRLEDAILENAYLPKADFTGAELRGARMRSAQLQGAQLDGAQLQGASLNREQVHAATPGGTHGGAQLQGASLFLAWLQGAQLDGAQLQGASLDHARLQGASLEEAQLQGASLNLAQLQGASLKGAQLQGASLFETFVWRVNASGIAATGAYVDKPEIERKYEGIDCNRPQPCPWSGPSYAALRRLIKDGVPAGERRQKALNRIAILDPENKEEPANAIWAELEMNRPMLAEYQKKLAERLAVIGCESDGAPYVARGLLWYRFGSLDAGAAGLAAAAFLDEAKCPGARGLSEEDKAALQKIRDPALPIPAAPAPEAKAGQ